MKEVAALKIDGCMHLLPKIEGCSCNRRIRSNKGPALYDMMIRMTKFAFIIILLWVIYAPPLNNQQLTNIVTTPYSANSDFPILKKVQKPDWTVDFWRKTSTQNSNVASGTQNALRYSKLDHKKIQNLEILLTTRTMQRIRRYTQNDYSTLPSREKVRIFIPQNRDRFDSWGG